MEYSLGPRDRRFGADYHVAAERSAASARERLARAGDAVALVIAGVPAVEPTGLEWLAP